ncbi:Hsp33 family molecular chaperone HslO [Flocculibacter collagenilyticus]|uniref:Hsp33 family molecular chaperone HslO n=1 Tax=Flocculibacter collagenilyticus TaxID=2744479 RepID=UPI0018F4C138|nr:Hsp33 family molecular chaperone HslO [Flocculibacter collagenilyticus]
MQNPDLLHRYIFDDLHVRGELVQLHQSLADILAGHDYPDAIKVLLAELMAATSLLTATLKFEGDIAVQLQGDGPVKYAVINGNHLQQMRGVARLNENAQLQGATAHIPSLLGNGHMVITITPKNGERYQGVVELTADTLAECLENYFKQSEQLETRLWLESDTAASSPRAGGMLLQVLPVEKQQSIEDFRHLEALTETITKDELLTLEPNQLLTRLYHQDNPKVFEPQKVSFVCGCSREKSEAAIINLGPAEINQLIEEQGAIAITCEYCNTAYQFSEAQLKALSQLQ